MIRVENLAFGYGEEGSELFSDLTMRVAARQSVAITGPSGIGKTSLLNLIAGLALPRRGEVWFEDQCISSWNEARRVRWRARHLGFVYQGFHLLPYLTVAENLALPFVIAGSRSDDGAIPNMLRALGIADLRDRYPAALSGGEQQRVAIGRALVHRPRLVLADEPTGNLDETTATAVLELLLHRTEAAGAALVMVTHSDRAAATCDRRFRLAHGRLSEST